MALTLTEAVFMAVRENAAVRSAYVGRVLPRGGFTLPMPK